MQIDLEAEARRIRGAITIELACRRGLPSIRALAMSSVSARAVNRMDPIHPLSIDTVLIRVGAGLGVLKAI